jgi:hypothetical protein
MPSISRSLLYLIGVEVFPLMESKHLQISWENTTPTRILQLSSGADLPKGHNSLILTPIRHFAYDLDVLDDSYAMVKYNLHLEDFCQTGSIDLED